MLYPLTNGKRNILSLDGIWEFRFADEDNWQNIMVPGSFNNQISREKARSYTGVVEYRRRFIVPSIFSKERRILRFDAVTHDAEVYIDGKEVGFHKGGFLPFEIDISNLECGKEHDLLVSVSNRINHHTFPIGNEMGTAFFGSDNPGIPSVERGKEKLRSQNLPNFDFFNYSGITRHVRVYTTPREYIDDITIIPYVDGENAFVDYSIKGEGDSIPKIEIYDRGGELVAKGTGYTGKLFIENAKLWNPYPEDPYLYKANVAKGEDEYSLEFGIRSVGIKGSSFLINGREFYFKGTGKHEDSPIRGRGVDECLNVKDIGLLKWINANSLRTSHYPYAEEMYNLCDKEGIVVIDELPAVGLNFQGEINPYSLGNEDYHSKLLASLIERDKNHPSVVMWSLGNEPDTEHFPVDSLKYWGELYKKAHNLDPQNRPVTMVCCQNDYTKDITTRTMDVVCINRYYGWYNLAGNLEIAKEAFIEEMEFWKEINKPLILTEYGADSIPGMHGVIPEMFTEEFQVRYLEAMNLVLDKYDFVIGEHPWNFADFDTQQGPMRAGGNHKGLFSRERTPKMAAYYIKNRWNILDKSMEC